MVLYIMSTRTIIRAQFITLLDEKMKKIFSLTSCKDLPNAIHSSLVKYLRKKLNLTKSTIKKNNKKRANFLVCNRTKTYKIKINLKMCRFLLKQNLHKFKILIRKAIIFIIVHFSLMMDSLKLTKSIQMTKNIIKINLLMIKVKIQKNM